MAILLNLVKLRFVNTMKFVFDVSTGIKKNGNTVDIDKNRRPIIDECRLGECV